MTLQSAVLALLAASASPLLAQEAADTASLPDLVVTATPVPVRPDALTAAVTVLFGDDLRERGIRFVHDALREVPGLFLVQQGSYGSVTSLFARGGESDYVKVLIDGVPANQPGGAFDFATLTTENVERIEIVRGPGSVMYGSDAVTGIVQIFTRGGAPRLAARAAAGGGTYGSHALELSAAGGAGRVGWSLGGSRFGSRGTYDFNNGFDNTVLGGKLATRPDGRSRVTVSLRSGWNTSEFPTDGVGAPVDSNQLTSGHTLTAGLEAGHALAPAISVSGAFTLTDTRLAFSDRADAPGDTIGFAFAAEREIEAARLGARLGLDFRPLAGTTITAGAQLDRDHERQRGTSTSNFGAGPFTDEQPPFDYSRWNRSYYLMGTADLDRGLGANAGIRVDDNEAFGTFVTARAGLAYRFAGATRVRGSFGTAFKAPTFAENFAASPFETGNPDLEPERTRSWEIGVEQRVLGRAVVSAGWFDQRFRNLIQYVPAAPGAPTYENLGAARARGIETGLRIALLAGISLAGQYTYLETEVTGEGVGGSPSFIDGERLLRRPAHAARGAVTLRRPRFTGSAAVQATGERDDVDFSTFQRVTLPSFVTVDLAGAVDVFTSASGTALAVLVRVENALDEQYQNVSGFPGRRRTLFAGARIER